LPTSIADAQRLDEENGNTEWINALCKELDAHDSCQSVRQRSQTHFRLQAGPWTHHVGCQDGLYLQGMVCCWRTLNGSSKGLDLLKCCVGELVRISLLLVRLNDLEVWLMDIGNAYLMAPTMEMCYKAAGDKFGPESQGEF